MAVESRLSSFKFCSLLISSGMAEKITLSVAWVIQERVHLLSSDRQTTEFNDVSDLQSPMDGGKAVMMTSV